ncbi:UDP-N-acetylmuramoyl-tripeptide--D-alanyl-D-alanine ligase [Candidatus Fermentibacterales bacterium]|nr:UDP-N-acetylmuramoyl-tripeptide--D-alanyl-D-alanine ligase [Candidatus Fermentibacterales bacterium]
MSDRTLGELAGLLGGDLMGDPAAPCGRVVADSREVGPGDLFIALEGRNTDGHSFVDEVLSLGGYALVRKNGWRSGVIVVEDPLHALWRGARARRARLGSRVVGLTGSNGKTTTRELINAGLSGRLRVERSEKNYNNEIGLPLCLLNTSGDAEVLVLEMGMNHPGELAFLGSMAQPDITIVTSIGRAHMEYFENRDAIALAKSELLRATVRQGGCVIPVGEPMLRSAAEERDLSVITVGDGGDVWLEADRDGGVAMPWNLRIRLSVPGEHNRTNALFALAACEMVGAPVSECLEGMASYAGMAGRGRVTDGLSGVRVLDESYNANPDSTLACLDELAGFSGALGAVLGEMRELGERSVDLHVEVLEHAATLGLRFLLLVGGDYRSALERADWLDWGECEIAACSDAEEAVLHVTRTVSAGDSVLVKGSHSVGLERVVAALVGGD